MQPVGGATHGLRCKRQVERHHETLGVIGAAGGCAAVQIRCQHHVSFRRQPIGHLLDVVDEPPPLLQQNDSGPDP
jgi:hypothetical protein